MSTQSWLTSVEDAVRHREGVDPFRWVRTATDAHRQEHRCWAYPYEDGSVLGAIVRQLRPARVLELGAALGYTACWWASGGAHVDAIEADPAHVRLARQNIERARTPGTIKVHEGDFDAVLPELPADYNLVFFDGYEPPTGLLGAVDSHLLPAGILVTTNLDLGGARFRSVLSKDASWSTRFVADVAISMRR